MARAEIRKADHGEWRERLGSVIARVMGLRGWSLKEFAAAVERDERQCSRWIAGVERPHFDSLFEVKELRPLLVLALAELAGETVEVETIVKLRRSA